MMKDAVHNTYGTRYRSAISSADISNHSDTNNKKLLAAVDVDRSSFSSPQNRRASTRAIRDSRSSENNSRENTIRVGRFSRTSSNSNMPTGGGKDSSTSGGGQGGNGRGGDGGSGGGERDDERDGSTGGGGKRSPNGSRAKKENKTATPDARGVTVIAGDSAGAGADGGASLYSLKLQPPGSDPSSLHKSSKSAKKALSNARPRSERVQEVLGALPMLLVDDSVSILKMTKKAIQNECAHIRFVKHLVFTFPQIPSHKPLCTFSHTLSPQHFINTPPHSIMEAKNTSYFHVFPYIFSHTLSTPTPQHIFTSSDLPSHTPYQHPTISHSIMEAKNGEEAFERVMEAVTSFELIVTDIQMPICDGFQFTRKVKR